MRTWNDYKEHVKATSPQGKADIEEMEAIAAIISAVIEQRNAWDIPRDSLLKCAISRNPRLQELNPAKLFRILRLW